jgi:nucleoside-diphosphate-sugar epimerase
VPQAGLTRHALIAGATGLVGRRIAEHLHANRWRVTGLSRSLRATSRSDEATSDAVRSAYEHVPVDLNDAGNCIEKLAGLDTVTHIFYAARFDHPEGERESVEINAAMLENLVNAIESIAPGLTHVQLVHGTKYYGHMLGPLALPLTEETPRANVPNFYFVQEDFVRARAGPWSYSTARPHTFCDASPDEPRNAPLLLAVYASLMRALDRPLFFPGSEKAFHARTQFTYVPMLARAVEWMATEPRCANQSYNIVNGDNPRWSELWPVIAGYFGVEAAGPSRMRLADYVTDLEPVWQALAREHGLEPVRLQERAVWRYADYLFAPEWDIISSASKARRDGFVERVETAAMFVELFDLFRSRKIIPT